MLWRVVLMGLSFSAALSAYAADVDELLPSVEAAPRFMAALQAQHQGNCRQADQLWADFLESAPDRPEALNNLAVLAYLCGQPQRSVDLIEQAAALEPKYQSIEGNRVLIKAFAASKNVPPKSVQARALQLIESLPATGFVLAHIRTTDGRAPQLAIRSGKTVGVSNSAPAGADVLKRSAWPEAGQNSSGALDEINGGLEPADVGESVKDALDAWARSWMARDLESYLSFYGPDFTPANSMSRVKWELQRHERLSVAKRIEIRIHGLQVAPVDGSPDLDVVEARFVQHYRSDRFEDRAPKTIQLRRYEGLWKIVAEVSGR